MIKNHLFIGSMLFAFSSTVSASGYFGLGFGSTDYDADDLSTFDDPTGIELYFGNKLSEGLGYEISYVDFGEASDGIPPEWHLDASSIGFSVLGIAQVGTDSEVFAKIGLHTWEAELREDGFGLLAEGDGTDILYGLGFRSNISGNFAIGVRYTVYDADGDDLTRLTVNGEILFD